MQKITAPKGVADLLPADSDRWQATVNSATKVLKNYGYKLINLPTFEATELFVRGVGDGTDIVNKEMYTFADKKGRSITLRPEMTAGVVRSILQHSLLSGALPLRCYYEGSCFRYEQPQSGRLREFHSIGIELFGSYSPMADLEVIACGYDLLCSTGLKNIVAEINSIGCKACRPAYLDILRSFLIEKKTGLCPTCNLRIEKNPMRALDCKNPSCVQALKAAPLVSSYLCSECSEHFKALQEQLGTSNIPYKLNPRIVRGLDYYNRTVFEFIHKGAGAQGTICGGGRYDGLVSQLGGPETAGIGFGLGIERLLMVLDSEGIKPNVNSPPSIYIASIGKNGADKASELALQLRRKNIIALCDIDGKGLKAQMKYADKIGCEYSCVIGETELDEGSATIKSMSSDFTVEQRFQDFAAFLSKG